MLLGSLAGCASHPPAGTAAPRKPNLIFIMADDLGWGDLGCYGQTLIQTPHLDRMAAEGVRFTDFYAASTVCGPTRCSLMTGLHTGHGLIRDNKEVGGWGPDEPEGQWPLPAGCTTLASLLRTRGYATGMVGKWGLGGPTSSGHPNEQGFDTFFGYLCQRVAHNHYPTHLWRNRTREDLPGNVWGNLTGATYSQDLFQREIEEFVRAHRDRPFFLYVPLIIPHLALQVPSEELEFYRGRFDDRPYDGKKGYLPHPEPRAAYAAMVSRMDRDIGRLLELLRELGLEQDTLVVFASDNGPTYDIGGADSDHFRSAGPFRGRKGSLLEGGIRVPLLGRWPGRIPAGLTVRAPSATYDLLPTFVDLAGGGIPDGVDGLSLVPLLEGRAQHLGREHLYWEFPGYGGQQAVRLGNYKGLRREMAKGNSSLELYDLSQDPGEARDLAGELPEIVERIESILRSEHLPSATFPLPGLDRPATRPRDSATAPR